MQDFLDFAVPSRIDAVFECSSSRSAGRGSVAVAVDAVYLGESEGIVRIDASDIEFWTVGRGDAVFALTIYADRAHVTHLATAFRAATIAALSDIHGPEGPRLRRLG